MSGYEGGIGNVPINPGMDIFRFIANVFLEGDRGGSKWDGPDPRELTPYEQAKARLYESGTFNTNRAGEDSTEGVHAQFQDAMEQYKASIPGNETFNLPTDLQVQDAGGPITGPTNSGTINGIQTAVNDTNGTIDQAQQDGSIASSTGASSGQNQQAGNASNDPSVTQIANTGLLAALILGQGGEDSNQADPNMGPFQNSNQNNGITADTDPTEFVTEIDVNSGNDEGNSGNNGDGGFLPWLLGTLGDGASGFLGSLLTGVGSGLSRDLVERLFGDGLTDGQRLREFFQDAFPGTNPWEWLGSSAASGTGQIQNQQIMQSKQLDTQLRIAELQANKDVRVAEIAADAPRQQADIASRKAPFEISNIRAQTGNAASQAFLAKVRAGESRAMTTNTELRNISEAAMASIANQIAQEKLTQIQGSNVYSTLQNTWEGVVEHDIGGFIKYLGSQGIEKGHDFFESAVEFYKANTGADQPLSRWGSNIQRGFRIGGNLATKPVWSRFGN